MSRQSFYLLKLPIRTSVRESESSAENEARYMQSEAQRDEASQASLCDYRLAFAEEELTQATGEESRGELFDQLMTDLSTTFQTAQQRRQQDYVESDTQHEAIFQKTESQREVIFEDGENSRAEAFKHEEADRAKRSEWHSANRETLLQQGRQKCKDTCAAFDTTLQEGFDNLQKALEDKFVTAENERDSIVRTLLDDGVANSTDLQPYNPSTLEPSERVLQQVTGTPHNPPTILIQDPSRSMSHELYAPRTIDRARSPGPTPWIHPPETLVPLHVPRAPSLHDSDSEVRSPTSRETPPHTPDSSKRKPRKEFDEDRSNGHFSEAQKKRMMTFLNEERDREQRFQAAEAARQAAEAERAQKFEESEQRREAKLQSMLDAQEEQFRAREDARGEGITRREEIFKAAQARRSKAFDMRLSQIENQAEAEERLEEDIVENMKSTTEALSRRQATQLAAARKSRLSRFKAAQQRRDAELGISPSGFRPSMRDRSRSPSPRRRPGSPRRYTPEPRMYQHPMAESRATISPPPRHRQFSPPVGFAGAALFRGGGDLFDSLPVPKPDHPIDRALQKELNFQNGQRRRQHIFERSQDRREEAFQQAAQRRRHIFSINEAKRKTVFEKAQRERKGRFEENEDQRATRFEEAQRKRETAFREAERKRGSKFHQSVNLWESEFHEAQDERAERFHRKQLELQAKCFQGEKKRYQDLETWGARLLQGRERLEMDGFREDEETCEAIFKMSIGSFVVEIKSKAPNARPSM